MKQKQLILTSAMAATLAALPGCSSGNDWDDGELAEYDTAVCVDQNGNRVDDDACDNDGYRGHSWFYIGRGGRLPYYGDSIYDKKHKFVGSKTAKAGAVYTRAPSTTAVTRSVAAARGGFGSSSGGYGGGRS